MVFPPALSHSATVKKFSAKLQIVICIEEWTELLEGFYYSLSTVTDAMSFSIVLYITFEIFYLVIFYRSIKKLLAN